MVTSVHMENFTSLLVREVVDEMNSLESDQAFNRVVSRWLGYSIDDEQIVDGAGDRGIDFWYAADTGFDVFQVKTHNLIDDIRLNSEPFDKEGVLDLHRIKTFLLDEKGIDRHNKRLKVFGERWNHLVSSKRLAANEDDQKPILVQLGLIVVGNGLTKQAQDEFDAFQRSLSQPFRIYENVMVEFRVNLYALEDIIEAKWREENREWKDISGSKRDWIELRPENSESLKGASSAVFYCPAIDLVHAYQTFGYQLFEPNVRCNITKSKVNKAIRNSVMGHSSRKEFRYLNNGVTLICKNYSKPSENRKSFRVVEPGIVNGLQTVISLSEAYKDLEVNDKADFEKECYILVRLLQENSVKDIDRVVRATNTQNTMEQRNLLSNNPEQILYEKLFAELGWFYERKQGAWEAFSSDHRRWRTLSNKTKSDFLVNPKEGRPKPRVADSVDIAQTWMSFVGFSDIAVHEKARLFEDEKTYSFLFLNRPKQHAYDIEYDFHKMSENVTNSAPPHELMIVSYLVRQFARAVTLSPRENRALACSKLGIKKGTSKEEVDAQLSKDGEYLLGLALSGLSYTFVEYFGYCLYRALGENIYNVGKKLLGNGVLANMDKDLSFKDARQLVDSQSFGKDDLLCVVWHSFRHVLNEMMSGFWSESFRSSTNRSRFVAQKETRQKILKGMLDLNDYTKQVEMTRIWASGIKVGRGLFGFIEDTLSK